MSRIVRAGDRAALGHKHTFGDAATKAKFRFEVVGQRRPIDDIFGLVSRRNVFSYIVLPGAIEAALSAKPVRRAAQAVLAHAVADASSAAGSILRSFAGVVVEHPGREAVTLARAAVAPVAATEGFVFAVRAEAVSDVVRPALPGVTGVGGGGGSGSAVARGGSHGGRAVLSGRAAPSPLAAAVAFECADPVAVEYVNNEEQNL